MRITKISVKGLFGMFDHEIPLNQESRITIIHGPNGVGKTVLLHMIHGLFQNQNELFRLTPFEQFRVDFEGGTSISVDKNGSSETLSILYEDGTETEYKPVDVKLREDPYLPNTNLVEDYNCPEWLEEILAETRIEVIDTLRLIREEFYDEIDEERKPKLNAWDVHDEAIVASLSDFAERFQKQIFDLNWYAEFLELWETMKNVAALDEDDLEELSGYIKPSEDYHLWLSVWKKRIDSLRRMILNRPQEGKYPREYTLFAIMDFFDIVNERFLFKQMTYRYESISFLTNDNRDIPLWALSSGEQNLLVLLFKLLFEVQPDTLVMIDEPELSMNVVWQRNFLKDLQRIIELRKFDVLIATHSPQIIHDKWDWTVALGEKMDD